MVIKKANLVGVLFGLSFSLQAASPYDAIYQSTPALMAKDMAIIVNDADPLSVKIAKYYQQKRGINDSQVIHLNFTLPKNNTLSEQQFKSLKAQVDAQTPKHIQAYALAWTLPFRVGCMSITSAFAMGFDKAYCARGCKPTKASPYFNSSSVKPFDDYKIRPTMALAGKTFADVKALIDRGVASDYSLPVGTAYLVSTSDKARNARAPSFPKAVARFRGAWKTKIIQKDYIENKDDVMFYFTGLTHVPKITSNHYINGAVADHLTSVGGVLSGSGQMNSLDWLTAGATGSYGTVVEPCAFPQKFPHPQALMYAYLTGSSLIEAYWKSVLWPGQGIFIGEPLAKPFAFPQSIFTTQPNK